MPVARHRMSDTRFYNIWCGMKKRCNKLTHSSSINYGRDGISYDGAWEFFDNFYADMFEGYSDDLTLDRVDPRKDYSKENCRWVTKQEQAKNKDVYKTNKTGVAGTLFCKNKGVDTLNAYITCSGIKYKRTYSLRKYTVEEALLLAEEWRNSMKIKLGFGENHA